MPSDDDARIRAIEQDSNNAHQGSNDAQQGRNNAQQDASGKVQESTNVDQAKTNTAQAKTNTAQGETNTEVHGKLQELKVLISSDSSGVLETIRLLAISVDANTVSMEAVAESLRENLSQYAKIDARFEHIEHKAAEIEDSFARQANTAKKMGIISFCILLIIAVGGFGLNAYRTKELCVQRNETNALSTAMIQDDVSALLLSDPGNARLPALQKFLAATVPVDCGSFPG